PSISSILLPSIPTAPIPPVTQTNTTPTIQYTRRARIAQSSALPTVADEPSSPVRDDSQREACPTDSGFIADQDRATITKSSTLPCNSAPRVTSPAAKEGSMQQTINELMDFCTSLQRQHLELLAKFQAQEKMLKALLSKKDKLLELANTPLNENYTTVILKKLPEKLGDPGKFLITCGFSELKCKALANLADFVIFDYDSDPRALLILGRPFLRTARALIDVHGEEMILCDGDERLTLNIRHNTS
nr:hypothetical protein [Tanacetum cinerariifolium]